MPMGGGMTPSSIVKQFTSLHYSRCGKTCAKNRFLESKVNSYVGSHGLQQSTCIVLQYTLSRDSFIINNIHLNNPSGLTFIPSNRYSEYDTNKLWVSKQNIFLGSHKLQIKSRWTHFRGKIV